MLLNRRRFLVYTGTTTAALVCAACGLSTAQTSSTATDSALAVSRCPRGLTNDPFPGKCHPYGDTNISGLCDLSEPG